MKMGEAKKPVSLGDIAQLAKVSRSTVSQALRNCPDISRITIEKVQKAARDLNYIPDARMMSFMNRVRLAKARELIRIAWLNTDEEKDCWHKEDYLRPYIEGARQRCRELGYSIDEFWLKEPGMTCRRISRILFNRGIQGVIIAPSSRISIGHIRLDWNKFSCASFENAVLAPRMHRITPDYFHNITLAFKRLRRLGYRRIGVFLQQLTERRSLHSYYAGVACFHATIPARERVAPLFYRHYDEIPGYSEKFFSWIEKQKPDAVVCQHSKVIDWLKKRGYRVPEDLGVAHLAVENDVLDWSGIWQRKLEIGMETAESVISMLQNHRLGLPEVAHDTLIQGYWNPGTTVIEKNKT